MKKIILGLLGIIGIAVIASPKFIGSIAEDGYQNLVSQIAESGAEITSESYQQSWLGADAVTEFTYGNGRVIKLVSKIQHGPFTPPLKAAHMDTNVYSLEKDNKEILLVKLITLIDLTGNADINIDGPKINEIHEGQSKFTMDAFGGDIHYNALAKSYNIDVAFPKIKFEMQDIELSMEMDNIKINYNARKGDSGLMLGKGEMSIEKFVSRPDSKDDKEMFISMEQFSISGDVDENKEQLISNGLYKIKKVTVADESYQDFILDIKVDNIPIQPILSLQESMQKLEETNPTDEQKNMAMMGLYMQEIPKILAGDPVLEINNFSVTTPEGSANAHAKIKAVGLGVMDMMTGGLGIIKKINVDADIKIAEKLLVKLLIAKTTEEMTKNGIDPETVGQDKIKTMINKKLEMMIEKGVVKREQGILSSLILLKEGVLKVNDQMVPLPDMSAGH